MVVDWNDALVARLTYIKQALVAFAIKIVTYWAINQSLDLVSTD
jgi:hypothetical protein